MQIGGGGWRKIHSMGAGLDDNPFQAGTGHIPALLAGRDEETGLLTRVLGRLDSPRAADRGELAKPPFAPVKIVGPRGVGKTALLNWAKKQAEERFIRFVSCEGLMPDETDFTMQTLLGKIAGQAAKLLRKIQRFGFSVAGKAGMDVRLREAELIYTEVVREVVEAEPLLLLLDEVQHYDLPLLKAVLQGSQKLIGEGYPLGLVLAGTPGLDSHLADVKSTFVARSQNIYINTLSDAATREALRAPFEQEGVKVTSAALQAMAAQTDNYPFFIQLVGQHAWNAMAKVGREGIDVKTVKRIEKQARAGRECIYDQAFVRIRKGGLLPQARRVMELFESGGGQVCEEAVLEIFAEDGVDASRAEEMLDSLKEDGFIWTVDGETAPGLPSFFNYFKDRCQRGKPPA